MRSAQRDAAARQPKLGDRVRVRREPWTVCEVQGDERCRILTLAGIGPGNLHRRQRVIAPVEAIEPMLRPQAGPRIVRPRVWRRVCRRVLAREGGWTALRAAVRAHADVLPYQLEPAIAVLKGLGNRVLLADEVGLGKTIQAAILIAELLERAAASCALILTPAGLRDQWADELGERFNLTATVVDLRGLRRAAARLGRDVSPWATIPLAIASLDYVKRAEVVPAVGARRWDIVVVDEAHLVASGSDRYAAVAWLCASAAFVILLTATPHSGDARGFESLCRLGAHGDSLLVFRRHRHEVRLGSARRVHRRLVAPSSDEAEMHRALSRYTLAVKRARGGDDPATGLLISILEKRAWSSAASLHGSVERRLQSLAPSAPPPSAQSRLPFDAGGELDAADAPPGEPLTVPALTDVEHERRLLLEVGRLSARAAERESKLRVLGRLLGRCRRRGERAIVFTEYRDTLLHIQRRLGFDSIALHGGMERTERRAALDAFVSGRAWLLLSTDAGSEGLNLHHNCRLVVHVELPWSPTRLEQRIGRVDRIGQTRTVHVWCLMARHTGEMRMLDHLEERISRAQRDIEVVDPLVSSAVARGAGGGRPRPGARPTVAPPGTEPVGADPAANRGRVAGRRSVDVSSEGLAEALRMSRVRLLSPDPTVTSIDVAALVARARSRVRPLLGGRALLVVESAVEDVDGRPIGCRLDSFLVRFDHHPGRADGVSLAVTLLASQAIGEMLYAGRQNGGASTRTAEIAEPCAAFWRTCLDRTRAIWRALTTAPPAAFQPGLFDRRADREYRLRAEEARARREQAAQRCALYARHLAAPAVERQTLLVLVP